MKKEDFYRLRIGVKIVWNESRVTVDSLTLNVFSKEMRIGFAGRDKDLRFDNIMDELQFIGHQDLEKVARETIFVAAQVRQAMDILITQTQDELLK